ncbi:prolyl oligopeptidase family serine peptidase [Actinoplanes sp. NPDC023801]|uniref:alpha/beta hydrolase family protein n=1 Tax=Actinoplanes sp. NPDC023801 TaxID=3154595 RepID=UPI0033BFD666
MNTLRLLMAAAVAAAPLLVPAPAQAAPTDVVSRPMTFANETGEQLDGLIYTPAKAQPGTLPGLVLLHGSGRGRHDTLRTEAEAFAAQGIAVLAYDKRTVGYDDVNRDYRALARDAVDAVEALSGQPGVDPGHVGVWGISEGGWVAPMAAAASTQVDFAVLASAPAFSPMRTERWNTRNKINDAGVRGSLVRALSDLPLRILEDAGSFAESRYEPGPVFASVTQPVLAVYGGRDVQVPPQESARELARTLRGHLSVRVLPESGHLLREGDADHGWTAYPGYPQIVGDWVRAVATGTPPAAVIDPVPAQREQSEPVSPAAPWERWQVQLAVFALIVLLPAAYPIMGLIRRPRGRRSPGQASPALLAGLIPVTALSALAYLYVVLDGSDYRGIYPGPVFAGRPVGWLVLQALSVATLVTTAVVVRRFRQDGTDRARSAVVLGGAALFVPWALFWGLLLP